MGVPCLKALDNLVGIHRMLAYVDNTYGNVGAMVAHTLEVGDKIRPNKSGLSGARPVSESYDMISSTFSMNIANAPCVLICSSV